MANFCFKALVIASYRMCIFCNLRYLTYLPIDSNGLASSRRSIRNTRGMLSMTNGPLTMSNLGSFPLESPFGLLSDRQMQMFGGGGLASASGTGADGIRFDFDEMVQRFPSPGGHLGERCGDV